MKRLDTQVLIPDAGALGLAMLEFLGVRDAPSLRCELFVSGGTHVHYLLRFADTTLIVRVHSASERSEQSTQAELTQLGRWQRAGAQVQAPRSGQRGELLARLSDASGVLIACAFPFITNAFHAAPGRAGLHQLGLALASLHSDAASAESTSPALPNFLPRVEALLAGLEMPLRAALLHATQQSVRESWLRCRDKALAWWGSAVAQLPVVACHGDGRLCRLLGSDDRRAVLTGTHGATLAPRVWDLAPALWETELQGESESASLTLVNAFKSSVHIAPDELSLLPGMLACYDLIELGRRCARRMRIGSAELHGRAFQRRAQLHMRVQRDAGFLG